MNRPLFVLILAWCTTVSAFQIEGVPSIPQSREQCGPASLAAVFSYYGFEIHPDVIAKDTYNSKLKGALITDLENFSRRFGFKTESGRGTLDRLKELIDRKKPVIALVDLGSWLISRPHYLVLVGHSEKGFIFNDGQRSAQTYAFMDFERIWKKAGKPYLVVYP